MMDARGVLGHQEVSFDVHFQRLVKSALADAGGRPEIRVRGGVVHQHIQPAQLGLHPGKQRLDGVGVTRVAGDRNGAAGALFIDGGRHLVQPLLPARGEHHGGAVAGQ